MTRDPAHSQYEIWREVGATYNAAGQYDDARTALERFLEHRESDPEGLYLTGRAHAGLGHRREAASLMEACINAVKTAPAYKYRLEKRWLNEAQQFLKNSGGQEAAEALGPGCVVLRSGPLERSQSSMISRLVAAIYLRA